MDRLTGKNNDYCFFTCGDRNTRIREDCNLYNVCYERKMYEKLKHYEDLEESGRLVALPEGIDGERMLDMIAEETCPSDFGLEDPETCIDYSGVVQQKCKDCWKAALKGENNGH